MYGISFDALAIERGAVSGAGAQEGRLHCANGLLDSARGGNGKTEANLLGQFAREYDVGCM